MGQGARSKEAPIRTIRRSYIRNLLIVFGAFVAAFAIAVGGNSLGFSSGIVVSVAGAIGFGSMIWFAFSSLDQNCPNCHYNLNFDMMKPTRPLVWFTLFNDPVICPNCKFDLSAASTISQDSANAKARKIFDQRIIVGAVLAPLLPGAIMALISLRSEPQLAMSHFQTGAILGYSSLPFGILGHYFLVRKRLVFLPAYLLLGGLLGVISFLLMLFPEIFVDPMALLTQAIWWIPFLILSFFFGILAGLLFWLIAAPNRI